MPVDGFVVAEGQAHRVVDHLQLTGVERGSIGGDDAEPGRLADVLAERQHDLRRQRGHGGAVGGLRGLQLGVRRHPSGRPHRHEERGAGEDADDQPAVHAPVGVVGRR
jgi:hypothetical protein